jgi:hypothetical protein
VGGNYAYVGYDVSGVLVFNVSDPANPAIVAVCSTASSAQHLVVDGNYLYVADGGDICVIDVSDPLHPSIAGSCTPTGWSIGIDKVGNYAYGADWGGGLDVVDVSDPRHPSVVGNCPTPWNASGVSVSGDYAYVAIQDSGMSVIDVSDPTNPFQVARYDSTGPGAFTCERTYVSGSHVYLAERSEVVVFDITDPPNLQKVGLYDAPHYTSYAEVAGDYMFVGCEQLCIADVADPTNPVEVGYYSMGDRIIADNITLANGCIYSPADSGLFIFESPFYVAGVEEGGRPPSCGLKATATIVRGALCLTGDRRLKTGDRAVLMDAAGRKVMELQRGRNDVQHLSPGVYFISSPRSVEKVLLTR